MANLVIVFIALGFGAVLFLFKNAGTISGSEARALVGDGATLVDVRSPSEFSAGHIEGAINIPVDRISERAGELGAKTEPVVVYCRSGARSARAKGILEGKGFERVSNLGAMSRWPTR